MNSVPRTMSKNRNGHPSRDREGAVLLGAQRPLPYGRGSDIIHHSSFRRGFTLVELMVVMTIIALAAAIAVPAIGPMLASNSTAAAVNRLGGVMALAQAQAKNTGFKAAVRIERAYKTNEEGLMIDAQGDSAYSGGFDGPVWLDHQQARVVVGSRVENVLTDTEQNGIRDPIIVKLPAGAWLAPGNSLYALDLRYYANGTFYLNQPPYPIAANYAAYQPFDTFYVGFNKQGQLASIDADDLGYRDQTQAYLDSGNNKLFPTVTHPYPSALSLITYDRKTFENITNLGDKQAFLQRDGFPIYINRFTGAIVEGEPQ